MHSLIFIVGMMLTGKENYKEWYKKINSILILKNLYKGICEAIGVPQDNKIIGE
jgi:hypothetical protein